MGDSNQEKKCPQCGHVYTGGYVVCPKCGQSKALNVGCAILLVIGFIALGALLFFAHRQ